MNPHQLISPALPPEAGHSPPLEAEHFSRLDSRGYFKGEIPVKRGHTYLAAQSCLSEVQGQLVEDVIALPLKELMFLHREANVEVAGWPSVESVVALAAESDGAPRSHTSGDPDPKPPDDPLPSRPLASGTGMGDKLPLPATALTGDHVGERAKEAKDGAANLSSPLAGRASLRLASRPTSPSSTERTDLIPLNFEFLLTPEDRLFEGEGEVIFQISSPGWNMIPPSGSTEEGLEDLPQPSEVEALKVPPLPAKAHRAVVGSSKLGIAQHLEGLTDLLKSFLGVLALIAVGVILEGQTSVGSLDLLLRCPSRYAEDFVIIPLKAHDILRGIQH